MNFAISNIAWKNTEDDLILNYLKKEKINNLEVAPGRLSSRILDLSRNELSAISTNYENLGFNLVSMQSLLFGASNNVHLFKSHQARTELKTILKRTIDIAGCLKINNLVFGSPKNRDTCGLNKKEIDEVAIPFFQELGTYAQNNNTIFSLEPNAPEYGTDFLTNTIETIQFIKKIDNPGIRLNLDLSTVQLNRAEPRDILDQCFDYINHIHISDPYLAPISPNAAFHKHFVETIRSYNYKNYLSIEMKPISEDNNMQIVKDAISFINSIYR